MSEAESCDGIRYLSVEGIVGVNQAVLTLTPDEPFGVLNQANLESAQQRPSYYRYYTQTEDIFTLAAVFGESLVQNHCFMNGNKRTAAQCVYEFLKLNGQELTAPGAELVKMYEGLAMHEYTVTEFADWLAYWSREYDTSQLNN